MDIENEALLKIVQQHEKQAWIGGYPPFEMDIVDLERSTNFRLSPNFHHQYDVVWLYEKRLDEYHPLSWKIILDEATRLLKEEGILVLKMNQTNFLTVPLVKTFLFRNPNLETDIYDEFENTIIFKIHRLNFEKYSSNSWTFAILTGGKKDETVIRFLKSIRDNDPENKYEIIISGPQKEIYDAYNVRYLDLTQFRDDRFAEISKKKNAIAEMASNTNLLIAHDRYFLDKHFFSDFEKFGYDWDFLALHQQYEDGLVYPYYCALSEPILTWTAPINFKCFEQIFNTQYVNGGLMIFKTHSLRQIKFNSLLFWNQMEDVEITHSFMENSLIPRVNFIAKAIVVNDSLERIKDIRSWPVYDGNNIIKNEKKINYTNTSLFFLTKKKRRFSINVSMRSKFPFIRINIKRLKGVQK